MVIDYKLIDDLILELNNDISDYTLQKEEIYTQVENLTSEQKELMIQIDDMQKIIDSYSPDKTNTHAVFSPLDSDQIIDESIALKEEEMSLYLSKYEVISEKLESKIAQHEKMSKTIDYLIELLIKVQDIKKFIKKQFDNERNELYVKELKQIQQKKRLLLLEDEKYKPIVSKLRKNYIEETKEQLEHISLALNFIQSEPVRAKQMLEKSYDCLTHKMQFLETYLDKLEHPETVHHLQKSIADYVNGMKEIYDNIKFYMDIPDLSDVDQINMILNRTIVSIFTGFINTCILKCNPKTIHVKIVYQDGFLSIYALIEGKYINFYEEMKVQPNSNIATVYEKIFLVHGDMSFVNKKDGTFTASIRIPVKNYLV